jgi:hypothetical protein
MLLRVIKLMPSPMIEVVDCFVSLHQSKRSFFRERGPTGRGGAQTRPFGRSQGVSANSVEILSPIPTDNGHHQLISSTAEPCVDPVN